MEKETKRRRFVRLGEKRTDTVLDKLRVLGGCANRRMYEYTEADVEKIRNAINKELDRVFRLFEDRDVFSLEDEDDD